MQNSLIEIESNKGDVIKTGVRIVKREEREIITKKVIKNLFCAFIY